MVNKSRRVSATHPINTPRSFLFRAVIALAAFTFLLAACSDAGGGSTTTAATGGPTTTGGDGVTSPTSGSEEPITLSMWVNREEYVPGEGFFDNLAAQYPNITVEVELVPDDDLFFQLARMSEAGEPLPDIVQLDDYFAIPMLDAGLQIPLNDFVADWEADDPEGFGALSPSAFFTNADGTIVGIAPQATMDVVYYRSDWFTQAGVGPASSWDGLLDAARAVKADQPDVLPLALPSGVGTGVNWYLSMLGAAGVEFVGSVPQLTSDAGIYTIEWLQTIIEEDLASLESLAWTDDESRGAWIGGQAATTYDTVRPVNDLGGAQIEAGVPYPDGWSIFPSPIKLQDGGPETGVRLLGARTYHITASSEHPDEAGLIIRLLTDPEQAEENLVNHGLIPLQPAILASDVFEESQPFIEPDVVDAFLGAQQRPSDSQFFQVVEILEQVVQDAFQHPDQPAEELAAKWQEELDSLAD